MADEIEIPTEDLLAGSPDGFTLDHAAWFSLTGPHAGFAEIRGSAARYPLDVSPFVAVSPHTDAQVWGDLAALVGPGGTAALAGDGISPPGDWVVIARGQGVQMVDTALQPGEDPEAIRLHPKDITEMLALVDRTKPGPFLPRTIELGSYYGIRRDGALVAMAGERLHPPGWTEVSAVCTDAPYRGQGLATRLVRTVAVGIRRRGETPFLHAAATNTNAIRLYQSIGFTLRRRVTFQLLRVPGGEGSR